MDSSFPYFGALDILVLRCSEENGPFQVMGSAPDWVRTLKGQDSEHWGASQLFEQSHFLQSFLQKAKNFWDKNESGQLESGPWQETTMSGEECDLEAKAVALGANKLLVIKRLSPHIRHRLQVARDKSLQREKERDDLLAILNRMQVGAIMTDTDGVMTFINPCALRMLATTEQKVIGQRWDDVCLYSAQEVGALLDMVHRPPERRSRVPIQLDHESAQPVCLEIDVQDDPRNSKRKLFFLYDVTEVQHLRRLLAERLQASRAP